MSPTNKMSVCDVIATSCLLKKEQRAFFFRLGEGRPGKIIEVVIFLRAQEAEEGFVGRIEMTFLHSVKRAQCSGVEGWDLQGASTFMVIATAFTP